MYPFMFLWGFLLVVRRNFYKAWVRDESSFKTLPVNYLPFLPAINIT